MNPRLKTVESLETSIQTLAEEHSILPALKKFSTSGSQGFVGIIPHETGIPSCSRGQMFTDVV